MDKHQHISQENVEEIERFLRHEMALEKREAFLTRMSMDGGLKRSTDEMRLLFLGVQEAALRGKLNDFHKSVKPGSNGKIKSVPKVVLLKTALVAASVIGVMAIAVWLIWFKASKEETLFANYFQPDPGLISAMSGTDNYAFDRAMIDYKTGDYGAAIKTWDSLQALAPGNDTLNYFLGSAWLATKQTQKAIPYLQKVAASPNSFFVKDAYWYLGLALLKEGNTKQAILFLEQSEHSEKDAILKRLNE